MPTLISCICLVSVKGCRFSGWQNSSVKMILFMEWQDTKGIYYLPGWGTTGSTLASFIWVKSTGKIVCSVRYSGYDIQSLIEVFIIHLASFFSKKNSSPSPHKEPHIRLSPTIALSLNKIILDNVNLSLTLNTFSNP